MNRSIIIGAIIIGVAILVNGFLDRHSHFIYTDSAISSTGTTLPAHSIAVLPFNALDGANDTKEFAAGIEREIVTRLTAQHVSTAAVTEAPRDGELLVGTVQHAGNRVSVNVQLIDATSRVPRWAETYEREITDVFALEKEIADSIAKSIAAKKT